MTCNKTTRQHKVSQGQVLLRCFQKSQWKQWLWLWWEECFTWWIHMQWHWRYREDINYIFETDNDTKEELEQTLKVDNRDASCHHEITRQAFLSAGTLLLSFLAEYFFSNFWVRRKPEHCLPVLGKKRTKHCLAVLSDCWMNKREIVIRGSWLHLRYLKDKLGLDRTTFQWESLLLLWIERKQIKKMLHTITLQQTI